MSATPLGAVSGRTTAIDDVFDVTVDDIEAATDRGDEIRVLVYAGDEILAFERVDDVHVSRELVDETKPAGGD